MKRFLVLSLLALALALPAVARADQPTFAIVSSGCLNSPNFGNAQFCFDTGTHEFYYWDASTKAYVASPGGNFDPTKPGPIGGTTPAAGSFTTLSASSTLAAGATTITGGITATTTIVGAKGIGTTPSALATFGTCNSGAEGLTATQTNSTAACSAGATATNAGTTHCQIYCNGTNWLQTGL